MTYGLGALQSPPDERDFDIEQAYLAAAIEPVAVPPTIYDVPNLPPVGSFDQGSSPKCFPPGTRIRMADGSNRPIEQIRAFEKVVSAEGRVQRVSGVMARDYSGDLVNPVLWGHSHLLATPEHPILTDHGYVAAGSLTRGTWVALPQYLPIEPRFVVETPLAVLDRSRRSRAEKAYYGNPQGRAAIALVVRVTKAPPALELTHDLGWLVGLYLAEGYVRREELLFALGSKETDTLVPLAVERLRSELGIEARIQHRPNNSVCVVAYGGHWAELFAWFGGRGSATKRLMVTDGPRSFLEGVFDGWLDGDGYASRTGNLTNGVTISPDLALDMFNLGMGLGRHPGIRQSVPRPSVSAKSRQPRWDVSYGYGSDNPRNQRYRTEPGVTFRAVRDMKSIGYRGPVFNLEVEGDHSYVAEGIGVHNCVAYSNSLEQASFDLADLGHNFRWDRDLFFRRIGGTANGAIPRNALAERLHRGYPLLPANSGNSTAAHRISAYYAVPRTKLAVQQALMSFGVLLFSGPWFNSWFSPGPGGVLPPADFQVGGHEWAAVGWRPVGVRCEQTWGKDFGDGGYFVMPWAYVLHSVWEIWRATDVATP